MIQILKRFIWLAISNYNVPLYTLLYVHAHLFNLNVGYLEQKFQKVAFPGITLNRSRPLVLTGLDV